MINEYERPGESDNFIQYSWPPGLHLNPSSPKYEAVVAPTHPTMGVNDRKIKSFTTKTEHYFHSVFTISTSKNDAVLLRT